MQRDFPTTITIAWFLIWKFLIIACGTHTDFAADLAYVTCGRFEAFYEYGLNAWDVAGGIVLVKEAGGTISDFSGGTNFLFGKEILTSNSGVHEEFLGVIREKFKN